MPACASAPKNLGGGVNPDQLRRALMDDAAVGRNNDGQADDERRVDSPMEDDVLLESVGEHSSSGDQASATIDESLNQTSVPTNPMMSSVPTDNLCGGGDSASKNPHLITNLMRPGTMIDHQNHQNSQHHHRALYAQHTSSCLQQPLSSTSLGSACSSAYSSACSSYVSDSSLCSSL